MTCSLELNAYKNIGKSDFISKNIRFNACQKAAMNNKKSTVDQTILFLFFYLFTGVNHGRFICIDSR